MSTSSIATLARAATLAALLVVPAAEALAADGAATQPSASQEPRQQAQVPGTTSAAPVTNGNDLGGDDPYAIANHRESLRFKSQEQKGFSNEPDWNGLEYRSH